MTKTMILPFLAVIVVAVKFVMGIDINEDVQNQIADWLVATSSIASLVYGIIKSHRSGGTDKDGE